MNMIKEGTLNGAFAGFSGPGTVFEFSDRARWRQADKTVCWHTAAMPSAKIFLHSGRYYIQIGGMKDSVEVVPDI